MEQPLDDSEGGRRTLTQAEIIEVAELGLRAERHCGTAQDLEWARADGTSYLVQTRPITTLSAQATNRTSGGAVASTSGSKAPRSGFVGDATRS